MKRAIVRGCKRLSIRKAPWATDEKEDLIVDNVKLGEKVQFNLNDIVYGWDGREYVKVKTPSGSEGYVPRTALDMEEQ